MRTCPKCAVSFAGDLRRCPLCGTPLEGMPTPEAFPVRKAKAPRKLARRVLWITTLAGMLVAILAGVIIKTSPWPVVFTCVALFVNYLCLRNAIVHRPDAVRLAERWFLALLAIAVLWWLATGMPWVASLVIPTICVAASIANTVLVVALRDTFVQGYAKYLLYDAVLGFVPLVFALAGWVRWPWLCYVSAIAAVILALALLLLTRRQLIAEIRKLLTA